MSAGTKVIQSALSHIGAHSVLQPAGSEALVTGRDKLNSMLAGWYDQWGIDMGTVPLEEVASELSEPMGARNWIEYNLAMELLPDFPGGQVTPNLAQLSRDAFASIKATWGVADLPKKQVRGTLPKGQGNTRHNYYNRAFFDEGDEIG